MLWCQVCGRHRRSSHYVCSRSCKRWRREIIQEISQKMAQIQNAGLGEFRLRDLNDEINKLIREKRHWEERIKKLGGPDYISRLSLKSFFFNQQFLVTKCWTMTGRSYSGIGVTSILGRQKTCQELRNSLSQTRLSLLKRLAQNIWGFVEFTKNEYKFF